MSLIFLVVKDTVLNTRNHTGSKEYDLTSRPSRAVIILYVAMVTLALTIAVYTFISDYHRTIKDIESRAEAYAISMATDLRWYVDVARQTLRRTASNIERGTAPGVAVLDADSDLPEGVIVGLYDENGASQRVIGASSVAINVSDRAYFKELKAGKEWVISNLISDRITGKKTFAVGLALRHNGEFKGAAVAYAPMDIFQDAWMAVGGQSSNVFILHTDGWITARMPPIDSEVYDTRLDQSFVDSFTKTPTGSYWAAVSPFDGVERVLGFAKVPYTPLVAVLGQSPDAQLMDVYQRSGVTLAILTPILILLGYATMRTRNLVMRQEQTERRLRASLEKNERLLLEIHHRVKNNLQSAQSLIRMYVKSPEVMEEIEPRIAAMAKVHEHIYRSDNFDSMPARDHVKAIAEQIIFSSSKKIELTTDIEEINFSSELAMPVGQLLNEAIINAVKYGFEETENAKIHITLKRTDDENAKLTIFNNGAPLPSDLRSGIGSRLMPAFASQINGTVETTSGNDGVTVTLTFPLVNQSQKA